MAAAAWVLALAAGCSLFGRKETYLESPIFIGPRDLLWETTLEVVRQRYPKDLMIDPIDGTFEAAPVEILSPFKGEGRRRSVKGKIEGEGRGYRVRLHAWSETNQALENPLSSTRAKWKNRRPDATSAEVMLAQIERIAESSGAFTIVEPVR